MHPHGRWQSRGRSLASLTVHAVRAQAVPDAHTPIMKMVFSGIEVQARPRAYAHARTRTRVLTRDLTRRPAVGQIDLLHATLDLPSIPEDIDINDINVLRNLDERSVRSLNGAAHIQLVACAHVWTWPADAAPTHACTCTRLPAGPRVADALLRLVPNVLTYRTALCAIKLWAQRTCPAV